MWLTDLCPVDCREASSVELIFILFHFPVARVF